MAELPGVNTDLKDRFYVISRSDAPAGPRVVAIAPRTLDATDADSKDTGGNQVADYDPYTPRSEEDVIGVFGLGSGAHRAYVEMVAGGATRPTIVALPYDVTDDDIQATTPSGTTVLDQAFEAAETVRPDIIVPWGRGGHPTEWEDPATPVTDAEVGFYADNATTITNSLAARVANYCKVITDRSHPCFAVMGVKPFAGGDTKGHMTAAEVASHLALANLYDHNSTAFVNGSYVSVVATEMHVSGYPVDGSFGWANGAATYAGYLSSLPSFSAATGKPVPNLFPTPNLSGAASGLRYVPTRPQQEAMLDLGVVPVAPDYLRQPVWVDAKTFGRETSDFSRLSTMRIVFDAMLGVRQTAQRFIGEPASMANRNSLETAITSLLRGMTLAGALNGSDFEVTYIPLENKAIIDLVLRPVFELRNIHVRISVDL